MTTFPAPPANPECVRPTGFLHPLHERAARAFKTLAQNRLRDALAHIETIESSESLDGAWKLYLLGLASVEQRELEVAARHLEKAASCAPAWGQGDQRGPEAQGMRLAGNALQKLGWVRRRQDRPDDAYRAHLSAYHVRNEHGSFDEVWETALSLGIDADVARKHDVAKKWYTIAVDNGSQCTEQPQRKRAEAYAHLASSYTEAEQHDDAVEAARASQQSWRKHDMGDSATALADMKLGYALLKRGESLHDKDPIRAAETLNESLRWLTAAEESLSAFGQRFHTDVRWCLEQKDFADRLRASLD